MGATAESQRLLPLARLPAASASPLHLASFESGFPSLVDEPELLARERDASSRWSTLSVLLTLLMSAIGSGTLSVPYTLLLLSPTQAVATIVLVGAAMAFTADVILRVHVAVVNSAQHEQVRETYQELAFHAGGEKLSRFVSFVAGFAVFGACVGCVRVVKDMAPTLLALVYLRRDQAFEKLPLGEQQSLVFNTVWIIFMAVVLPLGFFKKISVLRYSSYLGFTFCLYLVGAVAYRSIVGVASDSVTEPGLEPLAIHESFFSKLSVAIGIYNFTYMLHLNVIPLFPQVVASIPRSRRHTLESAVSSMSAQIYVAVAVCAALYAVFGLCAASIYGPLTQGNILLNLAHDPIMAVPRVMILLTILFSFPLLFHPLRCLVLEMLRRAPVARDAVRRLGAAHGAAAARSHARAGHPSRLLVRRLEHPAHPLLRDASAVLRPPLPVARDHRGPSAHVRAVLSAGRGHCLLLRRHGQTAGVD